MAATRRQRDYALERERATVRAHGRGFRTLKEQTLYNREHAGEPPSNREVWQRARILAHFGITKRRFDEIRRENRNWTQEYAQLQYSAINTYNAATDARIHDWSEQRVGYIIAFHAAIVNNRTNYESLQSRKKVKIDGKWKSIGVRKLDKNGRPYMNASQFYYLVKYTNLMSQSEFEARYGMTALREAREETLKP